MMASGTDRKLRSHRALQQEGVSDGKGYEFTPTGRTGVTVAAGEPVSNRKGSRVAPGSAKSEDTVSPVQRYTLLGKDLGLDKMELAQFVADNLAKEEERSQELIIKNAHRAREMAREEQRAAARFAREEREAADRLAREEREAVARLAREEREAADRLAREEREAAAKLAREEEEAADRKEEAALRLAILRADAQKKEDEVALQKSRHAQEVVDSQEEFEARRRKEQDELALRQKEVDLKCEELRLKERKMELAAQRAEDEATSHVAIDPLTDTDDVDMYLTHFERVVTLCRWKRTSWSSRLIALLRGKTRDAILRLNATDLADFEHVKKALLTYFRLDAEAYRKKFRSMKKDVGETFEQFLDR